MKKTTIALISIAALSIFLLGFGMKKSNEPHIYYQVYLDDEIIGTLSSKNELEKYIDQKGEYYKKKYGIENVYAPNGLEIKKIATYHEKLDQVKEVYEKIDEARPFTIKGFQFTMKDGKKNRKIYVTKKELFDQAVEQTMITFIGNENYNNYKNETQQQIETTGSFIENVYIKDDITVKETMIPVTETIYTNADDLAKFFLFGNNQEHKTYIVQLGDTIEKVSFNNKISIEEFLISNKNIKDSKSLLYPGQKVTIGITDPQITVTMEQHVVEDVVSKFKIEEKYDENMLLGDEEIVRKGENGLVRVSQKVKVENGNIVYVDPKGKEELKPAINQIVTIGKKYVPSVGSLNNWGWPTNSGYIITSDYGYRIDPFTGYRALHYGIDISGTGYGSPVYAVNNGVVVISGEHASYGNYIIINHNNGYYTLYGHMSRLLAKKGQTVARGTKIGEIGMTGSATGPHVHLEVWRGGMPWEGGTLVSPWVLY